MGVSNFDVLAQTWAVGPYFKILSNSIFNVYNEKVLNCWDFFGSCRVIPGKQKIGGFWVCDWSLTQFVNAPESIWEHNFDFLPSINN